ncbi:MAG: DUF692 domain-containing protein [Parvibaculum sp.]|uniref:MNIO family bufferin maturase n=1 Tax=Parvibaculum sp. TaxID=2024848 RepID=UPI003267AC77
MTHSQSYPDASPFAANPVPADAGIGLKPQHYRDIIATRPPLGWFEVHAENYMGAGGPPHRYLGAIREFYPLSLHGVGLSLGSAGPLDRDHVLALKDLAQRYEPGLISEHLAWTRHGDTHFNDLLPVPLTREALDVMVAHVSETQDILGRQILVENPSIYVDIEGAEMSEPAFLVALARRSGCGLLADINNVYVSCVNRGEDAGEWLDAIPAELVGEVHLAGHAEDETDGGTLLIDDHGSAVRDEVFALYRRFIARIGARPTLIERDRNVPELGLLVAEAMRAQECLDEARACDPVLGRSHG